MTRDYKLQILRQILISMLSTMAFFIIDQYRSSVRETSTGLLWARQLVTQAETLELTAREKGEKDPLSWAIDTLSQGSEARLVIVRPLMPESPHSQDPEYYGLDRDQGIFYYSKAIKQRNISGLRILIDLKTPGIIQGFLGTHSQITEDIALFFVFLAFFLLQRRSQKISPEEDLELRNSLQSLGIEIRDLLKQAHALVSATRSSHVALKGLREKIHEGLTQLHTNQRPLKELTRRITLLEKLASHSQIAEVVHEIKHLSLENEQLFRALEIQIEPCAMDADLSGQAHQNALVTADQMSTRILKTKEQLAHHIQLHRLKARATK